MLTVSDTGIGIAEADIPKAMAPFVQVDSSLSRKFNGTGLGLFSCRRIAREHGGEVTVKNRETGGTVSTLRLPLTFPDEL